MSSWRKGAALFGARPTLRSVINPNLRTHWVAFFALALVSAPLRAQSSDDRPEESPSGPEVEHSFVFGSYGRVVGASNLRGGSGKEINAVSFGPRLEESPYLELDFQYRFEVEDGPLFRVVVTPAITDALFHLDGDFDGAIALRNAFVDARDFGVDGLSVWAGSRMYRGDDIYLLDFWPLDELNTVGAGARYALTDRTFVALHGGVNQLRDDFQYQEQTVAGPGFATEQLIFLDRIRSLGSLRVEQQFHGLGGSDVGAKVVFYADYQSLGSGEFENEDDVLIDLPDDRGYTLGAQVGAWNFTRNGFANVFVRYSRGLAAYGELAIPYGTDQQRRVSSARLVRLALSFNAETHWVGVTGGAYLQRFDDADDATDDPDDYVEGVVVLRPTVFLTDHVHQAFEISYQRRRPDGLSRRTDTYLEPAMWKFGILPTISIGRGAYERPVIRGIYSVSVLNEGAQDLFPPGDLRHDERVHHFLGAGVEWWFNSSTYQ